MLEILVLGDDMNLRKFFERYDLVNITTVETTQEVLNYLMNNMVHIVMSESKTGELYALEIQHCKMTIDQKAFDDAENSENGHLRLFATIMGKAKQYYFEFLKDHDMKSAYELTNMIAEPFIRAKEKELGVSGLWRFPFYEPYLQKYNDIIDFGCGFGDLMLKIREFNPEAKIVGIDISDYCVNVVKELGFESHQLDVEDDVPEYHECELMIIQETLEHLKEPSKMIEYAFYNSKEALFTTPIEKHSDDITHLHHFTEKNIKFLFRGRDYHIEKIGKDGEQTHFLIIMKGNL